MKKLRFVTPINYTFYTSYPRTFSLTSVKALLEKCPMDVFDIEDIGGVATAKVKLAWSIIVEITSFLFTNN